MKINYLTLKGFRSYKEEKTFNFEDGINVITGHNGSGKSTILKAIRLLLLDKSDVTLEDLVNRNSSKFFIEIHFTHKGKEYRTNLKYSLKGKISEREIYIEGKDKPLYNTVTEVKDFLKTLFNPDLTYYAIALHQGSSEILKAKDSARLELFKKIRQIDFSKEAEDLKIEYDKLSKEDLNNIELEIISLKNKKYNFFEKKNLPYSEEEIEQFSLKIDNLNNQLQKIKEKEDLKQKIKSLQEEKQNISLDKLEEEIERIVFKIENLKNTSFTEQESLISELEFKSFEEDFNKVEEKYRKLKLEIENSKKELNSQISSIAVNRIRKIDFSKEKDSCKQKITSAKTEITQIKKTLDSLKEGVCPVCGKPTSSSELESYKKEIEEKEKIIFEEEKILKTLEKEEEENKKSFQENEDNKNKKQELISSLKLLEEKESSLFLQETNEKEKIEDLIIQHKNKIEFEKEMLKKEKENLKSSLSLNYELLEKTKDQKETLKEKLLKIEKEIEVQKEKISKFPSKSSLDINIEKEILEKKIEAQKDCIAQNKQAEELNKKIKKEKEEDSKLQLELFKKRDDLNEKVFLLKEARTILLKHFPNFIISSSIEMIEKDMNNFIEKVYTKPLHIKLRSTTTALKMEYGKERKLSCNNLSGAEEVLTSLGFIDSMNRSLGLNMIFMDEADAPLSKMNTQTLFEAIQNMDYEQIFIITHQDEFKSALEIEGAKLFEIGV